MLWLWKAPRPSRQGPHQSNHNVHPQQPVEQGACDWGPPQGQVQVPWPPETHISKKQGFTKFNVDESENMVVEKQLIPDGCGVKYMPLDKWWALHSWETWQCPLLTHAHQWILLPYQEKKNPQTINAGEWSESCTVVPNSATPWTVHRILQARILEWVAFPFSRVASQPRDWTQVSHITGGFFTSWAIREAL